MLYTSDEYKHRIETSIDAYISYSNDQVHTITHEYYELTDVSKKGDILTVRTAPWKLHFITVDAQLIKKIEDVDKDTIRFYLDTVANTQFNIKVGLMQREELCKFFYNIGETYKCKLNLKYKP